MSGVVISKYPSVVVQASEPLPISEAGDISLTPYDKLYMSSAPVHLFLVFEHPIHDPVETIRRGLAQALVHYYPVSGRLSVGGATGDELVIKCTGEGIPLVPASANCAVKDVQDMCDPSLQEELLALYPLGGDSESSKPLMLMQVTVFTCGGFVLGVTWNHLLGDGNGLGQFLQAVGELARGLPRPSVTPVRSQDSLKLQSAPPPFSTYFMRYMGNLQPSPMAFLDITVPASLIHRVRRNYGSASLNMEGARPCSVFDAVAAVLWRCRTRAIMADSEALTPLFFVANARKYAGAEEGYYGNCVALQMVAATGRSVAQGDIMDLVKMIRRAKNQVPGQSAMDQLQQLRGYNLLNMASWQNIGLDSPDFAAGTPARVTCYWQDRTTLPFCVPCLPCKDDYNVLSICVREEHAGAFRRELAEMQRTYCTLLSAAPSSKSKL